MTKIKSQDTKQEVKLRKRLWAKGFRFRKNLKSLIGKPDIVFPSRRIVIFVDGGFWHGYNWNVNKKKIKTNREFWVTKIEGNIRRDKKVNRELRRLGWKVLRYWEHDFHRNFEHCLADIVLHLGKSK